MVVTVAPSVAMAGSEAMAALGRSMAETAEGRGGVVVALVGMVEGRGSTEEAVAEVIMVVVAEVGDRTEGSKVVVGKAAERGAVMEGVAAMVEVVRVEVEMATAVERVGERVEAVTEVVRVVVRAVVAMAVVRVVEGWRGRWRGHGRWWRRRR